MGSERDADVYSADRMRRIVSLRRPEGIFQLKVEWLRSADGQRASFPQSGPVPPSACIEGELRNGLFGTAADANAEAHRVIEHEERDRLAAMTINERLFVAGLVNQFELAARSRDYAAMLQLLRQVYVRDAEATVEAILLQPQRYD